MKLVVTVALVCCWLVIAVAWLAMMSFTGYMMVSGGGIEKLAFAGLFVFLMVSTLIVAASGIYLWRNYESTHD